MNNILIFIESVAITTGAFMWILMILYGVFEKLVHKIDRKEMTQKQLEKGFWITSFVLSILLGFLVLFIINN